MAYDLDDKLVIGISSRALFDLDEANDVFVAEGLAAYRAYQREHEDEPLGPGTAFSLVKQLLAINVRTAPDRLVEVMVISRNDANSAMRVFNSIEHAGLDIVRGAFRNGRDPLACLKPFRCSLFLSAEPADVAGAISKGFPAGLVLAPPETAPPEDAGEVRIAFDGDAVLFSGESERIYAELGLDAFLEHEKEHALEPMQPGPFRPFLDALGRVQQRFGEDDSPIRTALITARNAPAHKRVVYTLRQWNVRIDETFFLGGVDKAEVIEVFAPHIYFDDQLVHLTGARARTPSAQVLSPEPAGELALFPDEDTTGTPKRRRSQPSAQASPRARAKRERESGDAQRALILEALASKRDELPDTIATEVEPELTASERERTSG